MKVLKYVRVVLALLLFVPITLFFVDFLGWMPLEVHGVLHAQLIPAVMRLNMIVVVSLLVLTLLFGRVYCSTLCPLGVLQDLFFRLSKTLLKDKNKSRKKKQTKLAEYREKPLAGLRIFLLKRTFYARPTNWLRYGLMAIVIVGLVVGMGATAFAADLLDPYSNFGRIATNLFRPVAILANNAVAEVMNRMGNYAVFKVKITTIETISFIFSSVVLLVVFALSFTRGRLYCNAICPVGSFLGLLSRVSLFQVRIDGDVCTSCGLCEFSCKSQCIDSEAKVVDNDRCVACFNCIGRCKKSYIRYTFALPALAQKTKVTASQENGRRDFLATSGALLAAIPALNAQEERRAHGSKNKRGRRGKGGGYADREPIMPPGARSRERFLEKCTACQLCITKCPSHVLKPAMAEYGWEGVMHPRMDFSHGFCNYDCVDCCSVCPNDALQHLTKEEKKLTQVGVVHFSRHHCVVVTDETSCGACSEHCPTQAVHMVDYKDGLTIPAIEVDICIGCGGCESICPVRPAPAIFIVGNREQILAEKPVEEEVVEKKVDDFGF